MENLLALGGNGGCTGSQVILPFDRVLKQGWDRRNQVDADLITIGKHVLAIEGNEAVRMAELVADARFWPANISARCCEVRMFPVGPLAC
jgi:hypothetical protein